ncbi:MAG: serine hydrolase domain-containing protein [Gemmatimonadaceae bacterium]
MKAGERGFAPIIYVALISCALLASVAARGPRPEDSAISRAHASFAPKPPWAPRLDSLVDSLERSGRAGAVSVSRRGITLYKRGFGDAARDRRVRNTPETLFDIGSIPKTFTAVSIFQLRDAGKLRVSDSLGRFFPSAPPDKRGITLWQLMTHSSGLQLYIDTTGGDFELLNRDSALALAFQQPLRFPPGTREAYSNTGYTVLAAVVEQACACSFEHYVREHVFQPARMTQTFFWGDRALPRYRGLVAGGYVAGVSQGSPRTWPRTWAATGANGVASSNGDLLRFAESLRTARLLSLESQREMQTTPFRRYAAGWDAYRVDSGQVISKGGSSEFGFKSQLRRHPAEAVSIVLLFNAVTSSEDQPHQQFGPKVSEIVLGRPFVH